MMSSSLPSRHGATETGHERPRVPPLQAVGRRGRGARLLDDDRGGADRRSLGGPAGGLGAAARDRGRVRRPARLRLAPVDHVLARVLLPLRPPEADLSRAERLPRPGRGRAPGAAHRPGLEVQAAAHDSHPAPRRGGAAHHRLARGSVRALRHAGRHASGRLPRTPTAGRLAPRLRSGCGCRHLKDGSYRPASSASSPDSCSRSAFSS